MTDKHPMDDVPMPKPIAQIGKFLDECTDVFSEDQLRAERIAAYELGRNAGLEEAAKWYAEDGWLLDEDSVPGAIKSLKR